MADINFDDIGGYKTIDNLGIGPSTRKAQDMEAKGLDLKGARHVVPQTQIDVTSSYFPTQSSVLTGSNERNKPFSDFNPPKGYNVQQRRVFLSYGIIPSLGNNDRIEANQDKLGSINNLSDPEKEQRDKLTSFHTALCELTKTLLAIEGSINQFQAG